MSITGLSASPNANHPVLATPRVPVDPRNTRGAIEMFSYRSMDGNTYTFERKVNGEPAPNLFHTIGLLCQVEIAKGGTPATILNAARMHMEDANGQVVFHFEEGPVVTPGNVEKPAGVTLS